MEKMDRTILKIGGIGALLIGVSIVLAMVILPNLAPPSSGPADLIFHNGTILTMEENLPEAEAIAVGGENIVAVGSSEEILGLRTSGTRVIDLGGRTLLPGFIDSHSHWIGDRELAGHFTPEDAIQAALANGWTSISELFVSQDRLDELSLLDETGSLRLRVNAFLPLNWQYERFGNWYQSYQPGQEFSPNLRIGGVKIFVDSWFGEEVFFSQEELNGLVAEAHQAGFQIAAHTTGDTPHDLILNAYENVLQGESNEIYRHRIEHVVMLRDDQLERMKQLEIVASFQLTWFHSDWIEEVETNADPEAVRMVGRWRDLLEAGVPSIGSTDHPWGYGTIGPSMKTIYQAVTRIGEQGRLPPQYMLDQRISVEQALRLVTIDAAYGTFQEDVKGSIAVDKLADLVVLSDNPITIAPERLQEIDVLATIVGGLVEYCASGYEDLCPSPSVAAKGRLPVGTSKMLTTSGPNALLQSPLGGNVFWLEWAHQGPAGEVVSNILYGEPHAIRSVARDVASHMGCREEVFLFMEG